jgi:hypothetical protein
MPGNQVKNWPLYHKVLEAEKKKGTPLGKAKEIAARTANANPEKGKK